MVGTCSQTFEEYAQVFIYKINKNSLNRVQKLHEYSLTSFPLLHKYTYAFLVLYTWYFLLCSIILR